MNLRLSSSSPEGREKKRITKGHDGPASPGLRPTAGPPGPIVETESEPDVEPVVEPVSEIQPVSDLSVIQPKPGMVLKLNTSNDCYKVISACRAFVEMELIAEKPLPWTFDIADSVIDNSKGKFTVVESSPC